METFRKMGAMKPAIVLRFFEQFYLTTVVLSDTDTVWLRDPSGVCLHLPVVIQYLYCLSWCYVLHMPPSIQNKASVKWQ
jgi:hypothetical protein